MVVVANRKTIGIWADYISIPLSSPCSVVSVLRALLKQIVATTALRRSFLFANINAPSHLQIEQSEMSQRLSHYICLSCRRSGSQPFKQETPNPSISYSFGRRRLSSTQRRKNADIRISETVGESKPLGNANITSSDTSKGNEEPDATPLNVKLHQARLYSPIDDLREQLLGDFRAYQRFQHLQTPELEWQKASPVDLGRIEHREASKHREAHRIVWENVEEYKSRIFYQLGQKSIRKLMKDQLQRCRSTRDILQIVAVAMQRRETVVQISSLHHEILAALYHVRQFSTDPDILSTLNLIVNRIRKENLPIRPELIREGLRFAARSRSLPAMKRYLRDAKELGVAISSNVFHSLVAKFSIGAKGHGEIRNGRWKRANLLQVLLGFDDVDPADGYHLGVHLKREDWDAFSGWIAVLARCKALDELWKEWERWQSSETRKSNRELPGSPRGLTVRTRGDGWFIQQLLYAGAPERAWQIVYETRIPLHLLKTDARARLMDHPEYARKWDEPMKQALMEKYEAEIEKIEQCIGVKWVSQGEEGFHVSTAQGEQAEELMEKLSELSPVTPHGYPEE